MFPLVGALCHPFPCSRCKVTTCRWGDVVDRWLESTIITASRKWRAALHFRSEMCLRTRTCTVTLMRGRGGNDIKVRIAETKNRGISKFRMQCSFKSKAKGCPTEDYVGLMKRRSSMKWLWGLPTHIVPPLSRCKPASILKGTLGSLFCSTFLILRCSSSLNRPFVMREYCTVHFSEELLPHSSSVLVVEGKPPSRSQPCLICVQRNPIDPFIGSTALSMRRSKLRAA